MADWKKIAKTVVASLEEAARDAKAQQQIKQRRGPPSEENGNVQALNQSRSLHIPAACPRCGIGIA